VYMPPFEVGGRLPVGVDRLPVGVDRLPVGVDRLPVVADKGLVEAEEHSPLVETGGDTPLVEEQKREEVRCKAEVVDVFRPLFL